MFFMNTSIRQVQYFIAATKPSRPGDIYLLGYNPGGSNGPHLSNSINTLLSKVENSYLDEDWSNQAGEWKTGQAPLQKRVCWILNQLGYNPRKICASNLIFMQSRDANGVDYKLSDICWKVHESILDIVKPKLLLVFGNSGISPYGYLHNKFGGEQEFIPSGHGNWKLKGFNTIINGQPVYVAGLPHLSRYSPVDKSHLINWLKSKLT